MIVHTHRRQEVIRTREERVVVQQSTCGYEPLIELQRMLQTLVNIGATPKLRIEALRLRSWSPELIPHDFLVAKLTTYGGRPEDGGEVRCQSYTIVIHDMVVLPEGRTTH